MTCEHSIVYVKRHLKEIDGFPGVLNSEINLTPKYKGAEKRVETHVSKGNWLTKVFPLISVMVLVSLGTTDIVKSLPDSQILHDLYSNASDGEAKAMISL